MKSFPTLSLRTLLRSERLLAWMFALALLALSAPASLASYPNNVRDREDEFELQFGTQASTGVSQWFVSEPYLNLWIYNQPSTYYTSWGEAMPFSVVFKQRNTRTNELGPLGPGWEHSGYS